MERYYPRRALAIYEGQLGPDNPAWRTKNSLVREEGQMQWEEGRGCTVVWYMASSPLCHGFRELPVGIEGSGPFLWEGRSSVASQEWSGNTLDPCSWTRRGEKISAGESHKDKN